MNHIHSKGHLTQSEKRIWNEKRCSSQSLIWDHCGTKSVSIDTDNATSDAAALRGYNFAINNTAFVFHFLQMWTNRNGVYRNYFVIRRLVGH